MIELHNIDCMEAMKEMPDRAFDLAIVDPPYGININMNMGRRKREPKKHIEKKWDNSAPPQEYFTLLKKISKNQIIWGGNYFTLENTRAWVFWDKFVPKGVSFSDGELAWTSFDRVLAKVSVPYSGFNGCEGKIHPTQKPVKLYEWLLKNYAKEGDNILDTHLGSGSIAIACYNMGYSLTGYEIDKDYYEAAMKRLEEHKRQGKLVYV